MSTNVSSVISHFPDAENGFTTTTAGSVASGAETVTLNSVAGYTNGMPVVLVIDPTDPTKKQTFTGIIDTAGVQITSVVWTAGTNQTHTLGATVVDYETATHWAMVSKGILVEHKQSGAHAAITANSISVTGAVTLPAASINQTALPLGTVVQVVSTNFGAVATGTTILPVDDTIPQITEGTEFMTQAITPKSATNILVIEVTPLVSNSIVTNVSVAIFQDATASALAASTSTVPGNTYTMVVPVTHSMVSGTTSSTTFRVRIGPQAAATTTFNGTTGGRLFGAITKSSIKITEYKA